MARPAKSIVVQRVWRFFFYCAVVLPVGVLHHGYFEKPISTAAGFIFWRMQSRGVVAIITLFDFHQYYGQSTFLNFYERAAADQFFYPMQIYGLNSMYVIVRRSLLY